MKLFYLLICVFLSSNVICQNDEVAISKEYLNYFKEVDLPLTYNMKNESLKYYNYGYITISDNLVHRFIDSDNNLEYYIRRGYTGKVRFKINEDIYGLVILCEEGRNMNSDLANIYIFQTYSVSQNKVLSVVYVGFGRPNFTIDENFIINSKLIYPVDELKPRQELFKVWIKERKYKIEKDGDINLLEQMKPIKKNGKFDKYFDIELIN